MFKSSNFDSEAYFFVWIQVQYGHDPMGIGWRHNMESNFLMGIKKVNNLLMYSRAKGCGLWVSCYSKGISQIHTFWNCVE